MFINKMGNVQVLDKLSIMLRNVMSREVMSCVHDVALLAVKAMFSGIRDIIHMRHKRKCIWEHVHTQGFAVYQGT